MRTLTRNEIRRAHSLWKEDNESSYLKIALKIKSLQPYFKALKNYRVIEIGPGGNPIINHYQCGEYIPANPGDPRIEKLSDGLSVLREEHNLGGIVVSFGVLDSSILANVSYEEGKNLALSYTSELVDEIQRVISPFGILVGLGTENLFGKPKISMPNFEGWGGVYFSKQFSKR